MGRAKKNPEYDPEKVMEQFTNCIVDAYGTGTDNNSLRKISEKFGITLMKTRKILITAGVYHTEISDQINSLREDNWSIGAVFIKMYTKTIEAAVKFHAKFAESNNLLLANSIANKIDDDKMREETLSEISKMLIEKEKIE